MKTNHDGTEKIVANATIEWLCHGYCTSCDGPQWHMSSIFVYDFESNTNADIAAFALARFRELNPGTQARCTEVAVSPVADWYSMGGVMIGGVWSED